MALTETPVLSKTFSVQCDASRYSMSGTVFTQKFEDGEHPIVYASRVSNDAEMNYTTTERECLALLWVIMKLETPRKPLLHDHN